MPEEVTPKMPKPKGLKIPHQGRTSAPIKRRNAGLKKRLNAELIRLVDELETIADEAQLQALEKRTRLIGALLKAHKEIEQKSPTKDTNDMDEITEWETKSHKDDTIETHRARLQRLFDRLRESDGRSPLYTRPDAP